MIRLKKYYRKLKAPSRSRFEPVKIDISFLDIKKYCFLNISRTIIRFRIRIRIRIVFFKLCVFRLVPLLFLLCVYREYYILAAYPEVFCGLL